nr:hypothetical protein Cplu_232 [Cedratvirus plubellavi]
MYNALYFTSILCEEELRAEIERGISQVPDVQNTEYRVNRVHRGEEYLKFGFLYVKDERVYHTFVGKNPDGTDRVVYRESSEDSDDSLGDWADTEVEREELPPLVEFENIRFYPVNLPTLNQDQSACVLCCRNFPSFIDPEDIREQASFFSSLPDYPLLQVKTVSETKEKKEKKLVFLAFSPHTSDAQYALLMIKSLRVLPSLNTDSYTLRFSHSYKNPKKDFNKKNL